MDATLQRELQSLWQRRPDLDEVGWARLYELAFGMLGTARCPELTSLPLPRDEYIQDFFTRRVFEPAVCNTNASRLEPPTALVTFFRNYLRDQLRGVERRRKIGSADLDTARETKPASTMADADFEGRLAMLAEATGMEATRVAASAKAFLNELPHWATLYLRLNACADSDTRVPLYRLSELHAIASHHHKARQLGLSRRKGEFEAGYEQTLIGGWLLSLAIEPRRENLGIIETALKILCQEALNSQGDHHGTDRGYDDD